jgi:hypothetical protein
MRTIEDSLPDVASRKFQTTGRSREDDDEDEYEAPGDGGITSHCSPSMPVQNLQNSVIGKALGMDRYV